MDMHSDNKIRGHYLGTEIDEKWWRRYACDGLLARGLGEFWMDSSALFFLRYLTKSPIVISLSDVLDVKLGKWHSGRWACGAQVVKIVWRKSDKRLCSGFVVSREVQKTEELVQKILSNVKQTASPDQQNHTPKHGDEPC